MKKFGFLLSLSFLLATNFLFAQKHLWQSPTYPPIINFNQKGQMAVFTYDRLSIYNVETGVLETTYDLIKNRYEHQYVWPSTLISLKISEDFKNFRISGRSINLASYHAIPIRFFTEKVNWKVSKDLKVNQSFQGLDLHGREIIEYDRKKEIWLYKANGSKINKIADTDYMKILTGGRFGVYKENDQMKLFDFSTETSTLLEFKGYPKIFNTANIYPEWVVFQQGDKHILFNPYTNEREEKDMNSVTPSKYAMCTSSNMNYYYGDYSYKIVKDQSAIEPDQFGAVPFIIEQYKASDCSLVRQFEISVSEQENLAKQAEVEFIYEGLKKMGKTYSNEIKAREDSDLAMAQKFANKKEAAELVKELLINFKEAGSTFAASLSSLGGGNISNLPYTKKYLTHLKGEVYAIAKFTNCKTSSILLVAVRNGTATHFKLIKIHYEGVYRETMALASVDTYGEKLTQNLSIFLTNTGYSIKAELTKTFANGKQETKTLFAPCSSEWK